MGELSFAAAVPVGAWHEDLPRALSSLKDQGAPLEVALLDASGDPRVAAAADESGLAFAYRRHGRDDGQAAAIAEGWARTRSDLVFWLNADDRLTPGALGRVGREFAADPEADVVFGGSVFVGPGDVRIGVHDQVAEVSPLLLRSNVISQPSCFARRCAVESVGGLDQRLHYVMDWDLWVRLYAAGARFRRVEDTLSLVFMGAGTKTAHLTPRRLSEVFHLVRRNAGLWSALKSTLAVSTGTLGRRWSQA
ncbi:MAG: glycosyltransferase [Oceanicaulis sp.]